jgi:hypothetical protein
MIAISPKGVWGVFFMWLFRPLAAFVSVSLALFSTSAFAATVSATQGQVLVNQGSGYQQVAGSLDVGPGATVVVNPGGSGQIVYPDGCAVLIEPGSIYTISPQSPCLAQDGGQATSGPSGTTLAIGAVVVGGGVAALLLLNNKDKSASP